MERYNQTFKCTCERGDVVLRTSRKDYSYGRQYYACPYSKPGTEDRGCGYFMWMDDLRLHISSSSGSSTPPSYSPGTSTRPSYSPGSSRSVQNLGKAECSNCKFLAEKIKTLEAKIKILEGALEMEMHPEKHTLDSAAILHELYNDMGKLDRRLGYEKQLVEELTEVVWKELTSYSEPMQHVKLIQLGIAYSFEDDIEEALQHIYDTYGEQVLIDALDFAKSHVGNIANDPSCDSTLRSQIHQAFKQPLRKRLQRLEATHYIPIYEQEASRSEILLKLAKLDFNVATHYIPIYEQEASHNEILL
ncbi:phospholipase-like protein [Tanacetum coccineum]